MRRPHRQPSAQDDTDEPRRASARPRHRPAGRPQPESPRPATADPAATTKIDFAHYEPGDIFATIFAGLPGFDNVDAPRRGEGAGPDAIADAGFAGPAQPLPHRAAIQAAFGGHDVSNVDAFVGGPAREAAGALDAEAYAADGRVAFAAAPDLHTAAHEAAHIVQQRGAASSATGVGATDDAAERHADAVADLVVSGRSAEALLSAAPPATGTARIRRKPSAERPAASDRAPATGNMNHPDSESRLTAALDAADEELLHAHEKTNVLATIATAAVNDLGPQDLEGETLKAMQRLDKAMDKDSRNARDVGKFLLGLGEIAVGIAELATKKVEPGAVFKIVKGAASAGDAVWDLVEGETSSTTELTTVMKKLGAQLAAIQQAQERVLGLLGNTLEIDIEHALHNAFNGVSEVLRSFALARESRGTHVYGEEFVTAANARLQAAAGAARRVAERARTVAQLLAAVGAAGAREMRSGTATRTLYDRINVHLLAGRQSEIELIQKPLIKTVLFRNGRVRRGDGTFRPVKVESTKNRHVLATSPSIGADLAAYGLRHHPTYHAAPNSPDGREYQFSLDPEPAGALATLASIGLRYRESQQVEFAIDSEDNVVAVSAEINARDSSWLHSEELAAMWQSHVHDVDGFVYHDHVYRIGSTGKFERVVEPVSARKAGLP